MPLPSNTSLSLFLNSVKTILSLLNFFLLTLLWRIWKHGSHWCTVRLTMDYMSGLSHIPKLTLSPHPSLSLLGTNVLVILTLEFLGLFWINSRYRFMRETKNFIVIHVYLIKLIDIFLLNYHCVVLNHFNLFSVTYGGHHQSYLLIKNCILVFLLTNIRSTLGSTH